jgi:hypothetical protein
LDLSRHSIGIQDSATGAVSAETAGMVLSDSLCQRLRRLDRRGAAVLRPGRRNGCLGRTEERTSAQADARALAPAWACGS